MRTIISSWSILCFTFSFMKCVLRTKLWCLCFPLSNINFHRTRKITQKHNAGTISRCSIIFPKSHVSIRATSIFIEKLEHSVRSCFVLLFFERRMNTKEKRIWRMRASILIVFCFLFYFYVVQSIWDTLGKFKIQHDL